ncbi:alpha/beta-Hydrolases superfamily protein [Actinidia rufa]|uniref:Alpha/beta-Hydrolases superfamily protein n=1 Tax=Actinidia rufa TaxID=165716 RepID=A0A7J0FH90_9ERIC|nr:alpha/beta-Hydrolases superfamily protein [Actinidia rufa]
MNSSKEKPTHVIATAGKSRGRVSEMRKKVKCQRLCMGGEMCSEKWVCWESRENWRVWGKLEVGLWEIGGLTVGVSLVFHGRAMVIRGSMLSENHQELPLGMIAGDSQPVENVIFLRGSSDLPYFGQRRCFLTSVNLQSAIIDFIHPFHLGSFHLVAHSMGCVIALALAAKYSKSVKSVTLIAPPYFHSPKNGASLTALERLADRKLWPPLLFGSAVMSWQRRIVFDDLSSMQPHNQPPTTSWSHLSAEFPFEDMQIGPNHAQQTPLVEDTGSLELRFLDIKTVVGRQIEGHPADIFLQQILALDLSKLTFCRVTKVQWDIVRDGNYPEIIGAHPAPPY